jgi:hypothetical protein
MASSNDTASGWWVQDKDLHAAIATGTPDELGLVWVRLKAGLQLTPGCQTGYTHLPAVVNWMCLSPCALRGLHSLPGGVRLAAGPTGCCCCRRVFDCKGYVKCGCQPYLKGYPWWPAQRLPPSAHDEVPTACPKPSSKSGASDAYQFFGTGEYQWILHNDQKIGTWWGLYKVVCS